MTKPNPEVLRTAREKAGMYLRGIRDHRGLSREELGKRCGMSAERVAGIEAGTVSYDFDEFLALTNALDCYFYLADRGGKHLDGNDLVGKMKDPI